MEVCVKQGEIVNKHLKVEMNVGDVVLRPGRKTGQLLCSEQPSPRFLSAI